MTAAVVTDLPAIWHGINPDGALDTSHGWVRLTWQSHRPHQVDADILGALWPLAWELVRDGLHHPTGIGDVLITPHPDGHQHEIVVATPAGQGAARVDSIALAAFVGDVQAVWADRDSTADIDTWLAGLLGDHQRPAPPPPAGGTA